MEIDPKFLGKHISTSASITFGCDPELFFTTKDGKVIGSEKVIPEAMPTSSINAKGIVQDGVQVELNPRPCWCRANIGNEISAIMKKLKEHLATMPDVSACFNGVVEVDAKELRSLSEKSRTLGCAPSMNVYDKGASVSVKKGYRKRSAGGHIHLGINKELAAHPDSLAVLMDIFVGNTCVLLDRDPANAERRKVYGRAGEYRTPPHGFEYRTLSNFWLRAYPLMSFVFGLSRIAVNTLYSKHRPVITYDSSPIWDTEACIRTYVDIDKVRDAINNNDVELARSNYQGVREFIKNHGNGYSGLYASNLDSFDYFIKMIDEKGLEFWFPEDPMDHWTINYTEGHDRGWENFMSTKVYTKMWALKTMKEIFIDKTINKQIVIPF